MKLIIPPLVVNDSDGFNNNDVFQRKQFGENLANLIVNSTDELVISLDGKWGEGKTTFVKMWQGLLKEKHIQSIYIDAFQNDYTEDAFISIASAITSYIDQNTVESEKKSDFKDKAKKVGIHLLSWTTKIGIKAATLGAIDAAEVNEIYQETCKEVAADTSKAIADLVEKRLSAHNDEVELINSLKKSLSSLPATLKDNSSGRLVIIIDELDRCKPTFAVEILEKIKHLFMTENVTFLLVMHKQQLENAIRCVYGNGIDAHTYLQKFINIETVIPMIERGLHNSDLKIYIQMLIKLHEIPSSHSDDIITFLTDIAEQLSLSLRQLEKIFTNIVIICSTAENTGNNIKLDMAIAVFIATVKVVSPGAFNKMQENRIKYASLCDQININKPDEIIKNKEGVREMMEIVRFLMLTELKYKEEIQANSTIQRYVDNYNFRRRIKRELIIPSYCYKLSMFSYKA